MLFIIWHIKYARQLNKDLSVKCQVTKEDRFLLRPIVRSLPIKRSDIDIDHTVFALQIHHTCLNLAAPLTIVIAANSQVKSMINL